MKVLLYNKPRSERLKKAGVLSGECLFYYIIYITSILFLTLRVFPSPWPACSVSAFAFYSSW
jgi:hypothetical protein